MRADRRCKDLVQISPVTRRSLDAPGQDAVGPAQASPGRGAGPSIAASAWAAASRQKRTERGKSRVQQQELDHALRLDPADVEPLVRLVGLAAAQHRRPLQVRQRQVGRVVQLLQQLVLDVEDAQRLVGAFQVLAELDELPALVVGQRGVADALEQWLPHSTAW